MLELRTFGGLSIKDDGAAISGSATQRKTLALLALLADASENGLSRDKLIAYLWPESDTEHGRGLLKQACYALRRDLAARELFLGSTELRLNPQVISSDIESFECALEQNDRARAVSIYTAPFLDGFYLNGEGEFERWVEAERARLKLRACEALESLATEAGSWGDARGAVEWWRRLATLDPFSSQAALGLMTALVAAGERAEAIQQGLAYAERLRAELNAAPPTALLELVRRLRDEGGEPAAAAERQRGVDTIVYRSRTPVSRRRRARAAIAGIAVFSAAALVAGLWLRSPARADPWPEQPRTMLVVLPFENLGSPDEEYFADGLSEAIITRLGSIGGIGVIARQSAMQYRKTNKSPSQIGRELGVEYLLTGTVRWDKPTGAASRVRVTPSLVRISDGAQVWAAQYDTTLAGIFAIQSSIAAQVAGALDIVLDTPEQRAVEEQPTQSLAAYDAYLRGHELFERGWDPVELKSAAGMLRRAVALDSGFRLAATELVRVDLDLSINYADRTPTPLREAKAAVDRLLRLGPDRPEARWALGTYYLLGEDHDPRRATEQFLRLARLRPNLPPRGLADASRRAARWEDAVGYHRRVMRLNPRSPRDVAAAGDTYLELRRFGEAISAYDRVLKVNPREAGAALDKALAYLGETGDLRGTQRLLPDVSLDIAPTGVEFQVLSLADLVTLLDDREQALVLGLTPLTLDDDTAGLVLAQAMVHRARGDSAAARASFKSARGALVADLAHHPDTYGRLHCMLGIALAGLGREDEAIRAGKRAIELMPVSRDAMEGPLMWASLARIYMMLGRSNEAVDELKLVLSRPGPLSSGWLRADPFWDPLRSHPGFQRLVNKSS